MYNLFTNDTNPAVTLVKMMKPYFSNSAQALALIDKIEPEQLNSPCDLVTRMAFVECELEANVQHTLGTQCLIYMFDPGNGWVRDCNKRCDMLLMIAKLVEKGSSLEGLYYYRNYPNIQNQSFKQIVQDLINTRDGNPAATLNDEVKEIFAKAGYDFSYPSNDNTESLSV